MGQIVQPASLESVLTPVILTPSISEAEISMFADVYNSHWRSYFPLTPEMLKRRLESGHLFIGVKDGEMPALLLQTLSLEVPLEDIIQQTTDGDYFEAARKICARIEYCYKNRRGIDLYRRLTNDGNWTSLPNAPNILWLMDITSIKKINGLSLADVAIDLVKSLIVGPLDAPVPGNPEKIQVILTFTPDIERIMQLHLEHFAFNTGHEIPDGRLGYKTAAVRPACYYLNGFYPLQFGKMFH